MTDLSALIERLERATGSDCHLNAEISAQTRVSPQWWVMPDWAYRNFPEWKARSDGRVEIVSDNGNCGGHFSPPNFIGSIDAAMKLLPPNCWWLLGAGKTRPDEPLYGAQVQRPIGPGEGHVIGEGEHAASAAIALCIAALRARQHGD